MFDRQRNACHRRREGRGQNTNKQLRQTGLVGRYVPGHWSKMAGSTSGISKKNKAKGQRVADPSYSAVFLLWDISMQFGDLPCHTDSHLRKHKLLPREESCSPFGSVSLRNFDDIDGYCSCSPFPGFSSHILWSLGLAWSTLQGLQLPWAFCWLCWRAWAAVGPTEPWRMGRCRTYADGRLFLF